jgi:hypothetical protein
MGEAERKDFLAWYKDQNSSVFYNKRLLQQYCQDDVTVLRQACQAFRREFKDIAKIEVFQESIIIASACNKVFRKLFLQPDTIGLIPTGGYSGNVKYSKKALMWLMYKEQTNAGYFTATMDGNTGCLNCQISVSTGSVLKQRKCTSFLVFSTTIPANISVTSPAR